MYLRNIADIVVTEAKVKKQLEKITLNLINSEQTGTQIIRSVDIMQRILENFPHLQLELIGKDDIKVEVTKESPTSNKWFVFGVTLALSLCLILIISTPLKLYLYLTGMALSVIIFFYYIGKDNNRVEHQTYESDESEEDKDNCYHKVGEFSAQKDK